MIERKKCLLCKGELLEEFLKIGKMPKFMGTLPYIFSDTMEMTLVECNGCGNVQLKSHPPLSEVYLKNHNIDLVGETWDSHFNSFKQFIGDLSNKNILEISDASAKLANKCSGFERWTIIEMNPHFEETEKIKIIKDYFSKDLDIKLNIDIIVHSHFFEHSLDPNDDLFKMYDLLPPNGEMYFSVPHLESLIKDSKSPTALNFEHTYYYDIDNMTTLLNSNGFEVLNVDFFRNHSLFFHVRKNPPLLTVPTNYKHKSRMDIFIDCYKSHQKNIDLINTKLKQKSSIFIYGSHVTSQYYLSNGLDVNIEGILDNSKSKNLEFLYGTNLQTFFIDKIKEYNECTIIVSHSSVYKTEIVNQINLNKSNTRVEFF